MLEHICILAHKYLDNDGQSFHVGGVETIVGRLAEHFHQRYRVTILQLARDRFNREMDGITVLGFPTEGEIKDHYAQQHRAQAAFSIFLTFHWGRWITSERAFVFQHGIEFDGFDSRRVNLALLAQKIKVCYNHRLYNRSVRHILDRAAKVLCVDLNFINWVRATFPFDRWEHKLEYVPNFSSQASEDIIRDKADRQGETADLRIIIPRRFETHRGVIPMARVARRVVALRPNVRFEFVGAGSQRQELERLLHGVPRCSVRAATYAEMPDIYLQSDISVIPTLWSEGTSLACIESMSFGCAVLATNVGGLGNLVFHNYNGSLVSPREDALFIELLRMVDDPTIRARYIRKGYEVVSSCFSEYSWLAKIDSIIGEQDNVVS